MITPAVQRAWVALGSSIVLSSLGQIALKHSLNSRRLCSGAGRTAPALGLGLWALFYLGATGMWLFALRILPLSYAYPLLGCSFVLVTAMAGVILHEDVSRSRWTAVAVITAGAACIAWSL